MITLPFSSLPGTTDLFNDYCAGLPETRRYFVGHFTDPLAYETHLQLLERRTYFRGELADALYEQNRTWGAGERTMQAIERLRNSNTVCVVTGQQVSLFTGPLYTIYKALTACKMALWLREQFPAYDVIPVFWLESEDHDLDEAGTTALIDRENDFRRLVYAEPDPEGQKNTAPVGSMPLGERIESLLEELSTLLPSTDFTADVVNMMREAYKPGNTFATAFATMLHALYPDAGLVCVDPSDPEIKKLLAPVVLQELETFPTSGEEVIKRSAELEERYHAQVKPRAVNLFYLHKGGRYPIEPNEDGFFLRGSRQRFTSEELLEIANVQPELFSPNVLLRPIFQDYLFPTAAYIAGPAEVAYFAQLQPVYDHFQIPMPVIVPRASITLVEQKITKLFNKFSLQYASMFDSPEVLYRDLPISSENDTPGAGFAAFKAGMAELLGTLPGIAADTQQQLVDPARATVQNIEKYIALFEEKFTTARREKDSTLLRQLEKLHVYLAPEGKPQERQYNITTYLNRYGRDILSRIETHCQPFPAEHRLLMV
ncbi:MAG: bacillithiol biosynthesis cysteine-adding enzyme BshC [Ignavibacteriae bacterium]|nr:bacillithiol biosynthesis cysteine-adding enzyme BshC [Ignavibacteriota bacterium]